MWWCIWTRIGGEYVVVNMAVTNDVGVVVVYGSGDVITCEQNSKL